MEEGAGAAASRGVAGLLAFATAIAVGEGAAIEREGPPSVLLVTAEREGAAIEREGLAVGDRGLAAFAEAATLAEGERGGAPAPRVLLVTAVGEGAAIDRGGAEAKAGIAEREGPARGFCCCGGGCETAKC